ncbi:carbamoyltransferase HypF [Corynebacterium epidermidicanis]|uniref:Carbamoyltransferase n=1 Tax=Corynebacterium epidermidicanis TaxID=1050174 RepID=A0A0G3GPJ0_9CORY|nr:carbamoyltransferase HypF [Corynebacterium epidermidicanis]AKK02505.1 (NiFe) hydrogenase maturation protein HypF [Corynebacterium epidermidicanis]
MLVRREFRLRGVVQGVGFRPHVAQVAARFPITGLCGNDDREVFIEAQGKLVDVERFRTAVLEGLPPLAHVLSVTTTDLPIISETRFTIVASRRVAGERTLIPPDVATCPDCLADMASPDNRRYRYPFTTCTNCGPRLTIIADLPYDRPLTTMKKFPMCPECEAEYTNPADRRYHAQPISCPNCGPTLWIEGVDCEDPILEAQSLLSAGHILAVKGLGGFHLLCDAWNEEAVAELRRRKARPGKPFAVMTPDLSLASFTPQQVELLKSPAHPIVIAPMSATYDLAPSVAPGLSDVGIMLPYTPLHTLLVDRPLVATSGNLSGEPLCYTNEEALSRLSKFADYFLLHDRDIHVPVEDSVFLESMPVRRSRGYAPLPFPMPGSGTVLAVGGELKNTFCLAHDDVAHVSAHIGDMGSLASQKAFDRSVSQMLTMQRCTPDLVVCDLHPNYATTAWAERSGYPVFPVQHHYAHALSLLASHGRFEGPFACLTIDGTGYGTDGTVWGGEVLVLSGDLRTFDRAWHLPVFPIVGGDRAVRQPWRLALGLAHAWDLPFDYDHAESAQVKLQLSREIGLVQTSSLGRLFDAVSAMLGVCVEQTYEAQAAMELERVATGSLRSTATDWRSLLLEILDDAVPVPDRAMRFHHGCAVLLARSLRATEVPLVGVTGGCALNRLLMQFLRAELAGLEVLEHHTAPANDGGLSLGQALAGRLFEA